MGKAYNHWFHCTTHTFGAWLHGDPRGFRTRHHREHVNGDYRRPPPKGKYDGVLNRSRSLMRRRPVVLSRSQQAIVVETVVASLQARKIEVLAVSMDRVHLHVLARFPRYDARERIGVAKREAWNAMRLQGQHFLGGLWGKRSRNLPIRDRDHQRNVFQYILRHRFQSAVVWVFDPRALQLPRVPRKNH